MSAGGLLFESDAVRAMSLAAHVLSQPGLWQEKNITALFSEAYTYDPGWLWSCKMLYANSRRDAIFFEQVIGLLEDQLVRLEGPDAVMLLKCRVYIASSLAKLASQVNRMDIAEEKNRSSLQSQQLLTAQYKKWKNVFIH
jgi:hypothetical protein